MTKNSYQEFILLLLFLLLDGGQGGWSGVQGLLLLLFYVRGNI